MAVKLSTSEILAAARAADGSRSTRPRSVATESSRLERIEEQPVSLDQSAVELSPAREDGEAEPRSVGAILHSVRKSNQLQNVGELRPTAIGKILADVRESVGSDLVKPPSVIQMLADVRQGRGRTISHLATKNPIAEKAENSSRPKRLSTAEILAAARKSTPAARSSSADASLDQSKTKRGSTADILAAARRQGAGTPSVSKSANREKPASVAQKTPVKTSTDNTQVAVAAGKKEPRPVVMRAVLDAVRSEGAPQPAVDPVLPSLPEMIAELRRVDRQSITRRPDSAEQGGWTARFQRWLNRVNGTHQGASI